MSRRIRALNNQGVQSLQCGRFKDAALCLHHALECIKTANLEDLMTTDPSEAACLPNVGEGILPCPLEFLDQCSLVTASPHNMFDVYQTAFFLPKQSFMSASQTAVVVLYNLGLVHHLTALARPQDSRSNFMEAQRFYKQSVTISRQLLVLPENFLGLVLGSLVNLGHVFAHGWNATDAEMCRSAVDQMLLLPSVTSLSSHDEEFFFNALAYCASVVPCPIAPAA